MIKWLKTAGAAILLSLGCSTSVVAQPGMAAIERYTESLFERSGLPGMVVALVHGDKLVYARGFGTDGNGGPVSPDTLFILGSTSKSFTALGILQLAETGRLKLDEPAARYLPGFLKDAPAVRQVTLRRLLNQTSGLSHEAGDQPVMFAGETGAAAIRHWALELKADALNRVPGRSYEYSNANYVVLGAVIEAVSGETYAGYMRAHVFLPLGMTHTFATEVRGLARGHKQILGFNIASDLPYPDSFVPAGFIVSSANDLAKYLSAQLPGSANARRLGLSDAGIALWHKGTAATDPEGKGHYAMGWAQDTFNGVPVIYHSGDTGVFSSEFTLEPRGRWGVIVLADGSGWLSQVYLQEISSGIVNMLSDRMPRDDSSIHRIVLAIYLAVLGIPLLQLLALWFMRNRKAGLFGQIWPVVLHVAAASGLIFALPRQLFGIPFAELLTSFPDMGVAALLSGACAVVAVGRMLLQRSWRPSTPRKTASARSV